MLSLKQNNDPTVKNSVASHFVFVSSYSSLMSNLRKLHSLRALLIQGIRDSQEHPSYARAREDVALEVLREVQKELYLFLDAPQDMKMMEHWMQEEDSESDAESSEPSTDIQQENQAQAAAAAAPPPPFPPPAAPPVSPASRASPSGPAAGSDSSSHEENVEIPESPSPSPSYQCVDGILSERDWALHCIESLRAQSNNPFIGTNPDISHHVLTLQREDLKEQQRREEEEEERNQNCYAPFPNLSTWNMYVNGKTYSYPLSDSQHEALATFRHQK